MNTARDEYCFVVLRPRTTIKLSRRTTQELLYDLQYVLSLVRCTEYPWQMSTTESDSASGPL